MSDVAMVHTKEGLLPLHAFAHSDCHTLAPTDVVVLMYTVNSVVGASVEVEDGRFGGGVVSGLHVLVVSSQ